MEFLIYLIKVISIQAIFYILYISLLKKETFFSANRWYLIFTAFLALVLPSINIQIGIEKLPIEFLPEVFINNTNNEVVFTIGQTSMTNWVFNIYLIIAIVFLVIFLYKLSQIIRLIVRNKPEQNGHFYLVKSNQIQGVFSFFKYVFVNKNIELEELEIILKHENIHIIDFHSLDLLFFEFLKIVTWINPFTYLYFKNIKSIHEYIADKKVLHNNSKENYINNLLNHTFETQEIEFTHNFYKQSLIKNRIIMMTKSQSKNWKRMNYLWVLPIISAFLFINTNMYGQEDIDYQEKENTFQEKAVKLVNFFNAHSNSRNLSEADYYEYVKLVKSVDPSKKTRSYKEYLNEVKNNIEFNLYSVSERNNDDFKMPLTNNDNFVPFSQVDQAPVYPGCEYLDNEAQMQCFSTKVMEHVADNFNVKIAKDLGLTPGKKRIFTMFTISKDGVVKDIKARGPHAKLEEEAIRVVKLLPKVKPGKQGSDYVNVKYSLPISFVVEEKTKKE